MTGVAVVAVTPLGLTLVVMFPVIEAVSWVAAVDSSPPPPQAARIPESSK